LIDPEFAIQNKELQGQWITNDKIGSAWVYWWYMKDWDLAIKESHNTNDSLFWWVEPPQTISGKPAKLQISGPADNLIMFPAKGHVKEAVDFINRILKTDVAETLNFGFEGVHWKRDENGNRYLTDEYNEIIWRWKYCDGLIFRSDYMIESENLEYGEWRIPVQAYAGGPDTWNVLLPPIPGIEDTITEISDYTQVELVKFIMGERPINQYDSFIQELKQKGLDNVLSAQQKVYDSQK
jgi:putative aldouronate transport system substrate-binding protein